jgi:creatinine deaminase
MQLSPRLVDSVNLSYTLTNVKGTEVFLREKGIQVDIKEDQKGIELYARFRTEKPGQDLENLRGLSAVSKKTSL